MPHCGIYLPGDLNQEAFVAELAARAADRWGTVDVVVLCHGLQASSPLEEMSYDDARELCGRAVVVRRSRDGRIVIRQAQIGMSCGRCGMEQVTGRAVRL